MIWLAVWIVICVAMIIRIAVTKTSVEVSLMEPSDVRARVLGVPFVLTAFIWAVFYILKELT